MVAYRNILLSRSVNVGFRGIFPGFESLPDAARKCPENDLKIAAWWKVTVCKKMTEKSEIIIGGAIFSINRLYPYLPLVWACNYVAPFLCPIFCVCPLLGGRTKIGE